MTKQQKEISKFRYILNSFNEHYKNILQETSHIGSEYHLEGDVYVHTMMVVKEAFEYELNNFGKLGKFTLAALLHDIGKYKAIIRDIKTHKNKFPGHAGIGVLDSISFINDIIDLFPNSKDIIHALYLVNYHDIHWENLKAFKKYVIKHKSLVEDLEVFNKFDVNGRISIKSKEYLTAKNISPINTNLSKDLNSDREIILLVGLPGAGKSSLLRHLLSNTDKFNVKPPIGIVSRDSILLEYTKSSIEEYNEAFNSLTEKEHKYINELTVKKYNDLINDKQINTIIIDMTNISFKSRAKWIRNDFKVSAYVLLASLSNLNLANKLREGKEIPSEVLLKMARSFKLPLYSEGIDKIHFLRR